jgi:hypothetical protein
MIEDFSRDLQPRMAINRMDGLLDEWIVFARTSSIHSTTNPGIQFFIRVHLCPSVVKFFPQ